VEEYNKMDLMDVSIKEKQPHEARLTQRPTAWDEFHTK
jgi:hypothetical protein